MDPVLDEVGQEHDLKELHNDRLTRDPCSKSRPRSMLKNELRRCEGDVGKTLNEQATNLEVKKIVSVHGYIFVHKSKVLREQLLQSGEPFVDNELIAR